MLSAALLTVRLARRALIEKYQASREA